jgi:hypothetical protein
MTDWVTYISQEEDANYGTCCEHRRRHNLSTANLDEIACETECPAAHTCPFFVALEGAYEEMLAIEEVEDYEQQLRNEFPPEEW